MPRHQGGPKVFSSTPCPPHIVILLMTFSLTDLAVPVCASLMEKSPVRTARKVTRAGAVSSALLVTVETPQCLAIGARPLTEKSATLAAA